jgi:flagellar protein FlgJ
MAMKVDPSLVSSQPAPLAARDPARGPDATDFRQFAALRRGAELHDPKTLREVARQFESIFTKMMLDSMRKASFGDPMFGSDQVDMYQGMMDDQMAMQLSQGRGIGLADMLIRQLSQGGAGAGAAIPEKHESGVAGSASPEQRKKFVDQILPHAQAAARALGVDARAIVAQAALETGWGTSQPTDAVGHSHNFFGI